MTEVKLSETPLEVINIGLESFAEDLQDAGVPVVQVEWRPPSGGDARLLAILALLQDDD